MADPILNQALQQLHETKPQLDRAKLLVKVMSEAGQDVTKERSQVADLEVKRQKYIDVLENNGAVTQSVDK